MKKEREEKSGLLTACVLEEQFSPSCLSLKRKHRREKYVHAVNLAYTTLYTAKHRTVILISSLDDEVVKKLHMIPCHDLNEAIKLAYKITNKEHPKITLLPHGINALLEFE